MCISPSEKTYTSWMFSMAGNLTHILYPRKHLWIVSHSIYSNAKFAIPEHNRSSSRRVMSKIRAGVCNCGPVWFSPGESIFSNAYFLNAEGQNAFCHKTSKTRYSHLSFYHPSQRNEPIRMWKKLIQITTGYFLRWRTSYHLFPGPPISKMVAESNFPPWWRWGQIPYPRALILMPVGCPRPSPHPVASHW